MAARGCASRPACPAARGALTLGKLTEVHGSETLLEPKEEEPLLLHRFREY